MKKVALYALMFLCLACRKENKDLPAEVSLTEAGNITYAEGFDITKEPSGITIIRVHSPWPGAESGFTYALVPRQKLPLVTLDKDAYDAIITIPVEKVVVTSTTHIPALESLGVEKSLVGFPNCRYISSEKTRSRIKAGLITELGNNESLNTERLIELRPDVVIGFSIDHRNKAYDAIGQSQIPVVYNGDWTEKSPLGKAEWIKFFAPFFGLETKADSLFTTIAKSYLDAKQLALKATDRPTVLSGSLYEDVWYLPGGNSWAAQFVEDANARYLWAQDTGTGSLSLSLESVLEKAEKADFWISPSQYTAYDEMKTANRHYQQFKAFSSGKIFTYAISAGETGGLLYYELGPNRPDVILRDLVHIFHPELLPDHIPFFFKPLR